MVRIGRDRTAVACKAAIPPRSAMTSLGTIRSMVLGMVALGFRPMWMRRRRRRENGKDKTK
ncbi:MAG: hypothetical protein ACR2PI_10430 [Hyphomicrobiaceae bacterium]